MDETLTLEKLKLHERLLKLEGCIQNLVDMHSRDSAQIQVLLNKHNESLYGNGKDGLSTRVNVLEKSDAGRQRHLLVLWASMASVVGKALWDALQRVPRVP